MSVPYKLGAKAPNFDLAALGGTRVRLRDFKGKRVVLYFYPRDDTPGCTQEALNFTENAAAFKDANAVIIGVSRDTIAKHEKFAAKHGLTVNLASDENGVACAAYGVWVEKSMYGKTSMGIERATFLIDEKGVLRRDWRKVRVKGHAEEVLAAVTALDATGK